MLVFCKFSIIYCILCYIVKKYLSIFNKFVNLIVIMKCPLLKVAVKFYGKVPAAGFQHSSVKIRTFSYCSFSVTVFFRKSAYWQLKYGTGL